MTKTRTEIPAILLVCTALAIACVDRKSFDDPEDGFNPSKDVSAGDACGLELCGRADRRMQDVPFDLVPEVHSDATPPLDAPDSQQKDVQYTDVKNDAVAPDAKSDSDPLEDVCTLACDGKECGDDGCGGSCGSCGEVPSCGWVECLAYTCIVTADVCVIDNGCLAEGKESKLDPCQWCQPQLDKLAWSPKPDGSDCIDNGQCEDGSCVCLHAPCGEMCCAGGQVCHDGSCCTPVCQAAFCGEADGCGGTCSGICEVGYSCTNKACEPDESLIGHWRLDQDIGIAVPDSSLSNMHGYIEGGGEWVTGVKNQALLLSGDGQHIDFGAQFAMGEWTQFTAAVWVKPGTPPEQQQTIFSKFNPGVGAGFSIEVAMSTLVEEGPIVHIIRSRLYTAEQDGAQSTLKSSYEVGKWQHVAMTYDGMFLRLYFDGAEVAKNPSSGNVTPTSSSEEFPFGEPMYLGTNTSKNVDQLFAGAVDEVKLFDRALSPSEIEFEATP
jgi:hypothetical protein